MNALIEKWLSIPEPTEDEWLAQRQKGLGGTDTAAILGESKWSSPLKVYKSKAEGEDNFQSNLSMKRGQFLEPLVAETFAERMNCKVYSNGKRIYRHPDFDYIYGTPDYFYELPTGEVGILEIKTAVGKGLEKFYNGIPQMYITQVHKYWMIMELISKQKLCCSIAIMLDDVVTTQEQTRDINLRNTILNADYTFWNNHVLPKIPPKPRDMDDVKALFKEAKSGSIYNIEDNENDYELLNLIERRKKIDDELKQHYKTAEPYEKEKKEIETQIRIMIEDNETVTYKNKILLTCKNISGKYVFNEELFKAENPELYAKYLIWEMGYRRTSFKNSFIEQAMSESNE